VSDSLQSIKIWCRGSVQKTRALPSLKKVPEAERSEWRQVTFYMQPLTWGANNDLLQKSTTTRKVRGLLTPEVDWMTYRELKLLWALKGWDLDTPFTPGNIELLHESVADVLLRQYDEQNYLSEDEKRYLTNDVDKYVKAQSSGQKYDPPTDLVEESLYRTYHWTPADVDRVSLKRMQRLFAVVNQRDATADIVRETHLEKTKQLQQKKRGAK
jgi:hypothetical protein